MAWIRRWGSIVWKTPVRPGIWRRKDGGFLITAWMRDRAGRRRQVTKTIPNMRTDLAQRELDTLRRERDAVLQSGRASTTLFAEFASSLFRAKVAARDIASAANVEKWRTALSSYLVPRFGRIPIAHLRHGDLAQWRVELAEREGEQRFDCLTSVASTPPGTTEGESELRPAVLHASRRRRMPMHP